MGVSKDPESNPLLELDPSKGKLEQWYEINFHLAGDPPNKSLGYADNDLVAQLCEYMKVSGINSIPLKQLKGEEVEEAIYRITPVTVLVFTKPHDSSCRIAYKIEDQAIEPQINTNQVLSQALQAIMEKLEPIEQEALKAVIDEGKIPFI